MNEQGSGAVSEAEAQDFNDVFEEQGIETPEQSKSDSTRPQSKKSASKQSGSKNGRGKTDNTKVDAKKTTSQDSGDDSSHQDGHGDDTDKEGSEEARKSRKSSESSVSEEDGDGQKDESKRVRGDREDGSEDGGEDGEEDREEDGERDKRSRKEDRRRPKIERRIQKLITESKAKDELIAQYKMAEAEREQERQREEFDEILNQDYTLEDFRYVKAPDGSVYQCNNEEAELAYLRWNNAKQKAQYAYDVQQMEEQERIKAAEVETDTLLSRAVEAQDILDEFAEAYPELDDRSPEYDKELAELVMPLVSKGFIKQPHDAGYQAVINPMELMSAIKAVSDLLSLRSTGENSLSDRTIGNSGRTEDKRSVSEIEDDFREVYKEYGIQ